jgi:hypothetical protein
MRVDKLQEVRRAIYKSLILVRVFGIRVVLVDEDAGTGYLPRKVVLEPIPTIFRPGLKGMVLLVSGIQSVNRDDTGTTR